MLLSFLSFAMSCLSVLVEAPSAEAVAESVTNTAATGTQRACTTSKKRHSCALRSAKQISKQIKPSGVKACSGAISACVLLVLRTRRSLRNFNRGNGASTRVPTQYLFFVLRTHKSLRIS